MSQHGLGNEVELSRQVDGEVARSSKLCRQLTLAVNLAKSKDPITLTIWMHEAIQLSFSSRIYTSASLDINSSKYTAHMCTLVW